MMFATVERRSGMMEWCSKWCTDVMMFVSTSGVTHPANRAFLPSQENAHPGVLASGRHTHSDLHANRLKSKQLKQTKKKQESVPCNT